MEIIFSISISPPLPLPHTYFFLHWETLKKNY